MWPVNKQQTGFTIIELLMVIVFLAVIVGFLIIGFRNFAGFQQFNQAVSMIEFELNQARIEARSAVDDDAHGVKFDGSSITTFSGTSYSASNPTNESIIYDLVTFTVTLTGGTDEIIFNKLTGLPSATGTILIEGVQFTASSTIEISETGVIQ